MIDVHYNRFVNRVENSETVDKVHDGMLNSEESKFKKLNLLIFNIKFEKKNFND